MMQRHGRVAAYPVYKIYLQDRYMFFRPKLVERYLRCMHVLIHLWFSKQPSTRLVKKRILCIWCHEIDIILYYLQQIHSGNPFGSSHCPIMSILCKSKSAKS